VGCRAVETYSERGTNEPTGRTVTLAMLRMRIVLTTALAIFFILDRLRHPLGRNVSKRGRFGA
jgi:hypothetical protein